MLIAAGIAAVLLVALLYAAISPPSLSISPRDGSRGLPVDSRIEVSGSHLRVEVEEVEVRETRLDPYGKPLGNSKLDGHLEGGVFVPAGGESLEPDARYDVTVRARANRFVLSFLGSSEIEEHATFYTTVTPTPIFSDEPQVVEIGQPIVVEFNTEIEDFTYELDPEIETTSSIDADNPTRAYIELSDYRQGAHFTLTVTSVTGAGGAYSDQRHAQSIATTTPLKVFFVPGDGESAVSQGARPTLTFSEEIRNPDAAESLLTIDPPTAGSWEWVSGDTLQFKPESEWSKGQQVTISLAGGPDGLRGTGGGFLREDVSSTFTIQPAKLIDVNLTTQTVTLYDEDRQVRTMICSSGTEANPSITGTYAIYAKSEKVHMRGDDYDLPDVPWVLMFNGDYTIHGNYWSTSFGVPSSHGCIGLPVEDAHFVYQWAPVGTIVSIHY